MVVREGPDSWASYFDREGDGLKGRREGSKKLEIELSRKERRKTKEAAEDKDCI